jgi:hypothetical protein
VSVTESLFSSLPPAWSQDGMRADIRRLHQASGRRFVVLDDDPTGSQCVHDVDVLLDTDAAWTRP